MSASGHSRQSRAASKASHFRYAAESGIKFRALAAPRPTDVIQSPKPDHRIMRDELSDFEWIAIKPMRPNKMRGVRINPNLARADESTS